MKKLYKYYSSKFDLVSYLESPNIRITQLNSLNDPFEGLITQTVLNTLIEKVSPMFVPDIGESVFPVNDEAKLHIQMQIDALGITSLSETSRNLLMWSHYASEHKGICIGYKNPLMTPHTNNNTILSGLRKVNYDSLLFDHEYIHLLKNKNLNVYTLIKDIGERILTTKSESWSYEKEHRYVMPIEYCNVIRYFKEKRYRPKFIDAAIKKAKEEGSHDVIIKDDHIDLISKRTLPQTNEAITDPESVEMMLRKSKNVMFLKNISTKNIDSIYFGAKHNKYIMNEAVDLIRGSSAFEGINLYHYNLSKERYEIDPIPL